MLFSVTLIRVSIWFTFFRDCSVEIQKDKKGQKRSLIKISLDCSFVFQRVSVAVTSVQAQNEIRTVCIQNTVLSV